MARKSNRQVRRNIASGSKKAAKFEREFNPDYSAVIKDLKRIGVLASTFFVVLIALTFILR